MPWNLADRAMIYHICQIFCIKEDICIFKRDVIIKKTGETYCYTDTRPTPTPASSAASSLIHFKLELLCLSWDWCGSHLIEGAVAISCCPRPFFDQTRPGGSAGQRAVQSSCLRTQKTLRGSRAFMKRGTQVYVIWVNTVYCKFTHITCTFNR